MNAGQIIGETLKLYETEYFFALTGGDQDIWLGLRNAGIKFILAHSERSAAAMADAYSRLTGKPSFTYGQWGPGAALCVAGVAEAFWARSPVVCITSAINSRNMYRYAYQGIEDQGSLFQPICKRTFRVPNIARLPGILRDAIRTAVSGVPGPVHIDISAELTYATKVDLPDVQLYADAEFKKYPAHRVPPKAEDISNVLEVVARAQRPLILAGGGVVISEAWDDLAEFARTLSIPVVTSMGGKSAMATSDPLAVGVIGTYSRKVANDIAARCDVCIVIGSNLGDMTTRRFELPAPGTKVIHIDLDPQVLGVNCKEEISMVADAKLALKALTEAARSSKLFRAARPWEPWVREVQSQVNSWRGEFQKLAEKKAGAGGINPYFLMAILNDVISPEDVIVTDTGYMGAWSGALTDIKKPGRQFVRTAGSLGMGFPLSLGAQMALKDKGRVICITGDGGMGYHAPDIETAVRCNLPVVVVLMNNSSLAFEYHVQKLLYKDIVPEVNDFLEIDYGAVARAFGAYGEKVRKPEDVKDALIKALDSGKPAVIDFAVDKEVLAPVIHYEAVTGRTV